MTHTEIMEWIRLHAPLPQLCRIGGWPDDTTLRMEVRKRSGREWIVDLYCDEVIQEMSECTPTRTERCGQFSLTLGPSRQPTNIRMLHSL